MTRKRSLNSNVPQFIIVCVLTLHLTQHIFVKFERLILISSYHKTSGLDSQHVVYMASDYIWIKYDTMKWLEQYNRFVKNDYFEIPNTFSRARNS